MCVDLSISAKLTKLIDNKNDNAKGMHLLHFSLTAFRCR